jgi:hypothetical protein
VFISWEGVPYRVGLIQRFALEVSTETFLPRVEMTFPCLNLFDEEPPEITDSTIRIVLEDAVSRLDGMEAKVKAGCQVFLGDEPVSLLSRVALEVVAGAPAHLLSLSFANEEWKSRWDSRIEELPEWIEVSGITRSADMKERPPIIKFGEGTLEWENTEYDETKTDGSEFDKKNG